MLSSLLLFDFRPSPLIDSIFRGERKHFTEKSPAVKHFPRRYIRSFSLAAKKERPG